MIFRDSSIFTRKSSLFLLLSILADTFWIWFPNRDLGEVKKAVEFFIASGATIASVQGATHYHTPFVTPYWIFAECMVYLGQVDNHLFYICDK